MPPRKKAAIAPDLPHLEQCSGPRVERYTALRPDGSDAQVMRCQDCGAQIVE